LPESIERHPVVKGIALSRVIVYTAVVDALPKDDEKEPELAAESRAAEGSAPPAAPPAPRPSLLRREARPARARRAALTRRLLKTKQLLDVILAHVRNGGSLITLCQTWDVRYSDFIGWIRADADRGKLYNEAIGDRSEWTDEMILSEIRLRIALDPRKLYDKDGRRLKVHELDAETARMIDEVKKDGTIKFFGKKDALELGARSRQLLTDKVKHQHEISLEDLLAASYEDPEAAPKSAPPSAPANPPAAA
jgi:hypothetical protein